MTCRGLPPRGLPAPLSRKNGRQLSQYGEELTPWGQQHLLDRARWDADMLRDLVRRYRGRHRDSALATHRRPKPRGHREVVAVFGVLRTRAQLTDGEWKFIGPYLPIGRYGPYPERLRQQFEGVIRRFKTGRQWREMPAKFGAWPTVHNRFRQWRDAGVLEAHPRCRRRRRLLRLPEVYPRSTRVHRDGGHPLSR